MKIRKNILATCITAARCSEWTSTEGAELPRAAVGTRTMSETENKASLTGFPRVVSVQDHPSPRGRNPLPRRWSLSLRGWG